MRLQPLYSCQEMCNRSRGEPGDKRARAASRCSLPDFDPADWDAMAYPDAGAEAERLAGDLVGMAAGQGITLDFELDRDGCPWGWVESRFARSVAKFMGRRESAEAPRARNLRLEHRVMKVEEDPEHLLDTVALAEDYEDGAFALFREACRSG